jgi:hypothetical protein
VVAAVALSTSSAVADAPRQLCNKTVELGWSVRLVQHGPDGQTVTPTINASRIIYVSSAGRLFTRSSRTNSKIGQSRGGDYAPDVSRNNEGEARDLHFIGNQLIGNVAYVQGAGHLTVTFDSNFSSCSLALIYGRDSGGMKRRGLNGVMYTIDSLSVAGERCSIREGNPFASP